MIIRLKEDGGTSESEITDNKQCCLNDQECIRLGEIALKVQDYYGNPRDIEWGIKDGNVYMLQSRPVTNLDNSFTEFEIMHEMDSGHLSEREIYTRAHWGENFPGACSWLLISFSFKAWDIGFARYGRRPGMTRNSWSKYAFSMGGFCFNQYYFSIRTGTFEFFRGYPKSPAARAGVITVFGHDIDDQEVIQSADERQIAQPPERFIDKLKAPKFMFSTLIFAGKNLRKTREEYFANFDLLKGHHFKTAEELFEHICNNYDRKMISKDVHGACCMSLGFFTVCLANLLASNQGMNIFLFSSFN